jgi:hypothetical protein
MAGMLWLVTTKYNRHDDDVDVDELSSCAALSSKAGDSSRLMQQVEHGSQASHGRLGRCAAFSSKHLSAQQVRGRWQ